MINNFGGKLEMSMLPTYNYDASLLFPGVARLHPHAFGAVVYESNHHRTVTDTTGA